MNIEYKGYKIILTEEKTFNVIDSTGKVISEHIDIPTAKRSIDRKTRKS